MHVLIELDFVVEVLVEVVVFEEFRRDVLLDLVLFLFVGFLGLLSLSESFLRFREGGLFFVQLLGVRVWCLCGSIRDDGICVVVPTSSDTRLGSLLVLLGFCVCLSGVGRVGITVVLFPGEFCIRRDLTRRQDLFPDLREPRGPPSLPAV